MKPKHNMKFQSRNHLSVFNSITCLGKSDREVTFHVHCVEPLNLELGPRMLEKIVVAKEIF